MNKPRPRVAQHVPATLLVLLLLAGSARAADPQAAADLFERRIRPVLIEHCYECHSEGKKIKGGLRLDTSAAWSEGGDSGPLVVPGKPEESLLIEALRSESDLKMPPKGRLAQSVIDDFERWVKLGAVDPREVKPSQDQRAPPLPPLAKGGSARNEINIDAGKQFWSYRPLAVSAVPRVVGVAQPQSEIDSFVLARLNAAGLHPAPQTRPATLVRRLYFDLWGLPPTPEQVDEFVADDSPEAWERLVDCLLAAPQFGERWGRHWLDVVRFAESLTLRGFILKDAWRYRDYVIDAFDRDLPYDQFLREQLAGDLLASDTIDEAQRRLVATTMFMLGNTNLEEQDKQQLEMDLVDEQLDVIGRGLLAQTITCARCHDHKFDPIPTRDYYALAGILKNSKALAHANVSKWIEVPLPQPAEVEARFRMHEQKLAALESQIGEVRAALKRATASSTGVSSPAIVAARDLPGIVVDDSAAKRVGDWQKSQHSHRYVGDGYLHDQNGGKGDKTLTFVPDLPASGTYEVRLAYTAASNRADNVPVVVFGVEGEETIVVNERQTPPIDDRFISLGQYRFERDGQSFVIVSNAGTKGHVIADAVQFLPAGAADASTVPADSNTAPSADAPAEVKDLRRQVKTLEEELKSRKAGGPQRPMAISVVEKPDPDDLFVHVRGSVHNRGPLVPRGFLQAARWSGEPTIPKSAGGRRQLADWIADRENPLTARVMVNRVWHWLFGAGLVRTTDNFGTTGELPSHPELLDHLALTFTADRWSVKRLIRRVVLSQTYRLSVAEDAQAAAIDPENRLLWRANRRRLDAECLRDAMLQAAGALDPQRGGSSYPPTLSTDYAYVDPGKRRSIYVPVFRNALPEAFEAFDFADPSTVTGRRNTSTVAPQALYLMNHPFVLEQSRLAAIRLVAENLPDDAARLTRAYRLILGRPPDLVEREIALKFLAEFSASTHDAKTAGWSQLIQSLFATVQFRYVE